MIPRDQLIARLREARYTFVNRQKRTELWRQQGGVQRVNVPLRDCFLPEEAAVVLQQAGLTRAQVDRFLASAVKC
ncbi:MAG: hypothetical protein NTU91_00905 [Chloroflexi bacterium]|nr:hypothetical protein [Chloroflexota bacterium]